MAEHSGRCPQGSGLRAHQQFPIYVLNGLKNESNRDFHNVAKDVPLLLSKDHVSACTGRLGRLHPYFLLVLWLLTVL